MTEEPRNPLCPGDSEPALVLDPSVVAHLTTLYGPRAASCLRCIQSPPRFTTLRVNTLRAPDVPSVIQRLSAALSPSGTQPEFAVSRCADDVIVTSCTGPDLERIAAIRELPQVVVDARCGEAVLRVVADLDATALKGQVTRLPQRRAYLVGAGVCQYSRVDIRTAKGVGIKMTERIYETPSLNGVMPEEVFLQNLPSAIAGHVAGEEALRVLEQGRQCLVLDMCSGPGGKTTHLAAITSNRARIVAFERSAPRAEEVRSLCTLHGATSVEVFTGDSTKMLAKGVVAKESANVILLDPPFYPDDPALDSNAFFIAKFRKSPVV
eukprot:m51a1_g11849 hypothetical protein (323) ;mRNA; f:484309-485702